MEHRSSSYAVAGRGFAITSLFSSFYSPEGDSGSSSNSIAFRISYAKAEKHYNLSKQYLFHGYTFMGKAHVDYEKAFFFFFFF
jgi:hypothetical protein